MRFVHTADWHLGRVLHGQSLLEDQRWWLDRFCEFVAERRPDAVVIAGDIYDRSVPPADAVALLDDTLARLVRDCDVTVILVAGNHDGPERIEFGSRVFSAAGLHVSGELTGEVRSVVLGEGEDATRFWLLPYASPIETRAILGVESIHDHEAAVDACVTRIRETGAGEPHQVLVTHHFVAGGRTSDSERGLSVGGTGAVPVTLFDGFDFVALGHLHRPQHVSAERIHYAGSPLKYSFDEAAHVKSVSVIELDGEDVQVERVSLGALRDMRRVSGSFEDVLLAAAADQSPDDYIEVMLDEANVVPDAHARLRERYPNLLSLRRKVELGDDTLGTEVETAGVESLSDEELFTEFFRYATGTELAEDEVTALHELLTERESGAQR